MIQHSSSKKQRKIKLYIKNHPKRNSGITNRVLFVLRIPPPYGGGEIVSYELYQQLKNDFDFLLVKQKAHSKAKQANTDFKSILRGVSYLFLIIKKLLVVRPDIVYIGIPKSFGAFIRNSLVYMVVRSMGITLMGEIHGMSFNFLQSKTQAVFYRLIINRFKNIRVLSLSVQNYLKHTGYKGEIVVINNGITPNAHLKKQIPPRSGEDLQLLFIGAITKNKGIFRIINLLRLLKENSIIKWRFIVIGEWINENEKRQVLEQIKKHNLNDHVCFQGRLVGEDKWNIMKQCDLLLHLSYFDGQPLSIIETMSIGVPTIASKVGGIPEMITDQHNGFLVDNETEAMDIIKQIIISEIDYYVISTNSINTFNKYFTATKMGVEIKKMVNS